MDDFAQDKDKSLEQPKKMSLKEGIEFTLRLAITDAAAFNHYVLKEYAPRCQGSMGISKSPAKHTLENCVYDEVCGWLDEPAVTGLSILEVSAKDKSFSDPVIGHSVDSDSKIYLHEMLDLLYDICKASKTGVKSRDGVVLDAQRLEDIVGRCKKMLSSVGKHKVNVSEFKKEKSRKVGDSLRKGRVSG